MSKPKAQTIKETHDAIKAIVNAFHHYHEASSDGSVSWMEWAGFVRLTPSIWDAVKGADEIPSELNDMDGDEADQIIGEIAGELSLNIGTADMRRKVDKILIAFHAIVDAVAEWRGVNPPRAEVVQ